MNRRVAGNRVASRVTQGLIATGVALFAAGALLFAAAEPAARATVATANFTITPASQTIDEDAQNITVDVNVSGVSGAVNWEFGLLYNQNVLDYVSAAPDPSLLQSSGAGVTCPGVKVNEEAGSILLGCLVIDGQSTASGSGKLATITFAAKDSGKSPLVFNKLELSGPEDTRPGGIAPSLPVSAGTGMIKVRGDGESTSVEPTPTVNPTGLTPTANGGTLPEEVDPNDPNLGPQTPKPATTPRAGVSSSSAGGSSGSSGSSSGGGTVSNSSANSGSGSSSSGGSGSSTDGSGATGADGAPVAGYGTLEEGSAWPRFLYAAIAVLGAAFITGGLVLSRRQAAAAQRS